MKRKLYSIKNRKEKRRTLRKQTNKRRIRRTRNLKGGWWKIWKSCDKENEIISEYLFLKNQIQRQTFSKEDSIRIVNLLINPNDTNETETDFKDVLNHVFNLLIFLLLLFNKPKKEIDNLKVCLDKNNDSNLLLLKRCIFYLNAIKYSNTFDLYNDLINECNKPEYPHHDIITKIKYIWNDNKNIRDRYVFAVKINVIKQNLITIDSCFLLYNFIKKLHILEEKRILLEERRKKRIEEKNTKHDTESGDFERNPDKPGEYNPGEYNPGKDKPGEYNPGEYKPEGTWLDETTE